MSSRLQIGIGKTRITPPVGVELQGFGYYIRRASTGVLDELEAKSIVWDDGRTRGAIVVCDLIGLELSMTAEIRRLAEQKCGIPADHVLVSCTHTHAGPATLDLIGWGELDRDYLDRLPELIAESVALAAAELVPVRLRYGESAVSGISFNRESRNDLLRAGLEHGSAKAAEAPSEELLRKERFAETTDRTMKTLWFVREDDERPVAFLAHYSCHPVVLCEKNTLISGDFVAQAVRLAEEAHGAFGLFLQGSIGDQNPIYCHEPQDVALQQLPVLAGKLADFISEALRAAVPVAEGRVAVVRMPVTLPTQAQDKAQLLRHKIVMSDFALSMEQLPDSIARRVRFEKAAAERLWERLNSGAEPDMGTGAEIGRKTELFGLRLGPILLLAHPTELFFAYHPRIEEALAPNPIFLAGICNDYVGYIPTPDKYDTSKYSYPAYFGPLIAGHPPYASRIGDELAERLIQLGRTLLDIPS